MSVIYEPKGRAKEYSLLAAWRILEEKDDDKNSLDGNNG